MKTLMIYSSVDGQTLKICNFLQKELLNLKQKIDLYSIVDFNKDLNQYDKIIIGSSIRYGVHNEKIIEFINTHKTLLDTKKTAFFSVNLVARKPAKNKPDTNPYVIKFFKKIDWKPKIVEVFAGKLDYKKYGRFDRIMIQFIMWMTKGPTDTNTEIEYTNWDQVKTFAKKLKDF